MLIVLVPTVAAMGYYNQRVTGSPFRMPYQVNRSTYSMAPYFVWQHPRPEPEYRHAKLRAFYYRELADFQENVTLTGFLARSGRKLLHIWKFFLGAALSLGLLALPITLRDHKMRVPLVLLLISIAGLLLEIWELPHYFAPAMTLIYLLTVQSMRHIYVFRWWAKAVGAAWVRSVCLVTVGLVVVGVLQSFFHPAEWQHLGNLQRAQIVGKLNVIPGQHLVIVDDPPPFGHGEWVYNRANIDSAKIVWARDMGSDRNAELINYFRGRTLWTVNVGDTQPTIRPYQY